MQDTALTGSPEHLTFVDLCRIGKMVSIVLTYPLVICYIAVEHHHANGKIMEHPL